ncbi:hypothetical protein BC941DRAFT_477197 [Chlamydoabsidia padenii]|nr:hypothetical protein BC941DRAFT_477197 [Chlamydoabsidia padenii]
MAASSTSDDDVRTDEGTSALPLDAEDVYSRKNYYRRCGFFIERSFGPRLDDSIEKLSKSFGKSNPSKEEFLNRLQENAANTKRLVNLYKQATYQWNRASGVEKQNDTPTRTNEKYMSKVCDGESYNKYNLWRQYVFENCDSAYEKFFSEEPKTKKQKVKGIHGPALTKQVDSIKMITSTHNMLRPTIQDQYQNWVKKVSDVAFDMSTIIHLTIRHYLEGRSSTSTINEIVPLTHVRNAHKRLLFHPDRDLKTKLKDMMTRSTSTRKRLFTSFTYEHLCLLCTFFFGKKQRQIQTQSSINVAQVAQSSPTSSLPSSSTHAPQVPQVSTSLSEASSPASTTGSLGISTLDVEGDNNFLLPGEVRDQLNITDMPDGYREMILPELQVLETNIMNMPNDNRVAYVLKKALIVLLRIYLAPEREKTYYDRITRSESRKGEVSLKEKRRLNKHRKRSSKLNRCGSLTDQQAPILQYEDNKVMELRMALAEIKKKMKDIRDKEKEEKVEGAVAVVSQEPLLDDDALVDVRTTSTSTTTPISASTSTTGSVSTSAFNEINTAIPDLSGEEINVMKRIFMFFKPFVLLDVGEEEIDYHVLVNLFILDACNAILQCTGYGRYCRKLMSHTSPGTLHSLHLNNHGLYYASKQLLYRDIKFSDDQKIKNVNMVSGKDVNEQARYALLDDFFDTVQVNKLCKNKNIVFDNKIIITSAGIVRIQAKGYESLSTSEPKSKTKSTKETPKTSKNEKDVHWNAIAELKKKTKKLQGDIKEFKKPVQETNKVIKQHRKRITGILESIKTGTPNIHNAISEKNTCVENRKTATEKSNGIYRESPSSSSPTKSQPPSSSSSEPSAYLKKDTRFVDVGPGVKTMASAVMMVSFKSGGYLMLANKYGPLQDFLEEQQTETIKNFIQVTSKDITANHISAQSRLTCNSRQLQYQKRKNHKTLKSSNDENSSITMIERKLSDFGKAISSSRNFETMTIAQHNYCKQVAPNFHDFYHHSNWSKKQKKDKDRFTNKTYDHAAVNLIKWRDYIPGKTADKGKAIDKGKAKLLIKEKMLRKKRLLPVRFFMAILGGDVDHESRATSKEALKDSSMV